MKKAFVLGNGVSRKNIDLSKLSKHGSIYGCNALYREYTPNYLIAVDVKMILEITKNGYQLNNEVWTNPNKRFDSIDNLNFFKKPKGWSSGPTALDLCCQHKNQEIYILGFDYIGIKGKINNIYAGTKNYKNENEKEIYHLNWLNQTKAILQKNYKKRFIRVFDEKLSLDCSVFEEFSNLEHLTVKKFKKLFEC